MEHQGCLVADIRGDVRRPRFRISDRRFHYRPGASARRRGEKRGPEDQAPQATALIEGLPAEVVIADTAYDADHLRKDIAAKKALAVIPNNPSRALKYPLDKHLYAQRHLVECCFSKTQAVPSRRYPLRKNRPKLPSHRHSRCYRLMDAISVHTA